jgi:hypothetical protein
VNVRDARTLPVKNDEFLIFKKCAINRSTDQARSAVLSQQDPNALIFVEKDFEQQLSNLTFSDLKKKFKSSSVEDSVRFGTARACNDDKEVRAYGIEALLLLDGKNVPEESSPKGVLLAYLISTLVNTSQKLQPSDNSQLDQQSTAAEPSKSKSKKSKTKKPSVTFVVHNSLPQQSRCELLRATTSAGYAVKNIFGRGVATIAGMFFRSMEAPGGSSGAVAKTIANAASSLVLHFQVEELRREDGLLLLDAAVVRLLRDEYCCVTFFYT